MSTWVLSPLAGIPFYRALLGVVLLCGMGYAATTLRVRSVFADRRLIPFAAFGGLHLASFLAISSSFAIGRSPDVRALAVSMGVFGLALGLFQKEGTYDRLIRGVVWATTAIAAALILWHLLVFNSPFLTPTFVPVDFSAGFTRKNQLAFFLALIFPYAWARLVHRPGWRTLIPAVVIMSGQLYTFSRMAVLATLIAIAVPCLLSRWERRRFQIAALLILTVVGVASVVGFTPARYLELRLQGQLTVIPAERADALRKEGEQWVDWNLSRARYIRQALDGFNEAPVFGHGIASFNQNHLEWRADGSLVRRSITHNDYAQVLYELGAAGVLAFVAMLGTAYWTVWRRSGRTRHGAAIIDGHLTALVVLAVVLNLVNAYETLIFWVLMAGSLAMGGLPVMEDRAVRHC